MNLQPEEISQIIKDQIAGYEKDIDLKETGTVLSVGDGIARVYGGENCQARELLEFPGGIYGLALNLEEDNVGCAILGDVRDIKEGDTVKRTGRIAEVPVGPEMEGRVVDGIGQPLEPRLVEQMELVEVEVLLHRQRHVRPPGVPAVLAARSKRIEGGSEKGYDRSLHGE